MDTFLKECQSIERNGFANFFEAASQAFLRVQREMIQVRGLQVLCMIEGPHALTY